VRHKLFVHHLRLNTSQNHLKMKQKIWVMTALMVLGLSAMSLCGFRIADFGFRNPKSIQNPKSEIRNQQVQWYSWEQAVELNKTKPKKFMVDVYTDWCGWCKVMDRTTFPNDTIATYLNKYFYCVKLNAEQRDSIRFNNYTFKYLDQGRNGVHELAYSLVDGQLSYPTIVYLSERFERIVISPGYKKPAQLLPELRFTGEEFYKTKTWDAFMQGQ
jgi:thioredoxin-related protein